MVVPRSTTITGPTRRSGSTLRSRSPLRTRPTRSPLCRLPWQRHGRSSDRAASLRMPSSRPNLPGRQLARSTPGAQRRLPWPRPVSSPVAPSSSEQLAAACGKRPTLSQLPRPGLRRAAESPRMRSGQSSSTRTTRVAIRSTWEPASRTARVTPRPASASTSRPMAAAHGCSSPAARTRRLPARREVVLVPSRRAARSVQSPSIQLTPATFLSAPT